MARLGLAFGIRARQLGFFTIEWADDNSGTEQGSAGAPNFERLGEVFQIGCLEGFATVTFLTGKRDSIYEICIDDMRLHLYYFPHSWRAGVMGSL